MSLGLNIAGLLATAVLSAAGIGLALWWLVGEPVIQLRGPWTADQAFNFAKIVLSIVGGIGGVVALVIAYRRQRLGEAAEQRENAKLFAENFTKASEQLGSDQAPVRLAGMYALERLAQTPEQQQTIVNVLCAYLRMPYTPPTSQALDNDLSTGPAATSDTFHDPTSDSHDSEKLVFRHHEEGREQERQVRLTAQRILAEHLRPVKSTARIDTFWPDIDLDLTGATLLDIDFRDCRIRSAKLMYAQFSGDAFFNEAEFHDDTMFGGQEFGETELHGDAQFDSARVRIDVLVHERNWPTEYEVIEARMPDKAQLPDRPGTWGYLRRIPNEESPQSASSLDTPSDQNKT